MKKIVLGALLVGTTTAGSIVLSAPGEREVRWMILDHECQSSLAASYEELTSQDWRKQVDKCQETRSISETVAGDKAALERHCARVESGELRPPESRRRGSRQSRLPREPDTPSRGWINQCAYMKAEFVETDEHAERAAEQLRREYDKRERERMNDRMREEEAAARNSPHGKALTAYYERCSMSLSIRISQKLANGEYFGSARPTGLGGPSWPVILVFLPGHTQPQFAGMLPSVGGLRKLGTSKVRLESGFDTDAQVYQVGDKKCTEMLKALQATGASPPPGGW